MGFPGCFSISTSEAVMKNLSPPDWITRLLTRFADPGTLEEVQGDLQEMYSYWANRYGVSSARRRYLLNVIKLMRPFAKDKKSQHYAQDHSNSLAMIQNYFKVAFRNLLKNKGYSAINIGGLAAGMAVAILIGLWIHDEFLFNRYHDNYDRIAKVMQTVEVEGIKYHGEHMPAPMGKELGELFGSDFKQIVMSSFSGEHIVAYEDKKFTKKGIYMSPQAPDLFSLKMIRGTRSALRDTYSVMLSESVAEALFGNENPIDKIVKLDNRMNLKVTGVYQDLPYNTEFREMNFIAPWDLYVATQDWVKRALDNQEWDNNSWQILVEINTNSNFESISKKNKRRQAQTCAADCLSET